MSSDKEVKIGYPAIAHVMAAPGLTIFKRFTALNARNLLYMQGELLILESELDTLATLDNSDEDGTDETKRYARSCANMREGDGAQWEKVLEIRDALEKYNAALIQQAEISKISTVRAYDHRVLGNFVNGKKGNLHIADGIETLPFDTDPESMVLKDLVNVQPRPELDSFTRVLAEKSLPWLTRRWKWLAKRKKLYMGDEEAGLREWDDEHFSNIMRVMAVLISTLFPSIAVLVLYYIPKLSIRLGAVLLFSLLFSGVLAAFTRAKPVEIFAATAACASVQVVFVGSTSTL